MIPFARLAGAGVLTLDLVSRRALLHEDDVEAGSQGLCSGTDQVPCRNPGSAGPTCRPVAQGGGGESSRGHVLSSR
jgi:hypothetical protein